MLTEYSTIARPYPWSIRLANSSRIYAFNKSKLILRIRENILICGEEDEKSVCEM